MDSVVFIDRDFPNILVVPSSIFSDVNATSLVAEGKLVFQDKASTCIGEYLRGADLEGLHVIETRAGCGMNDRSQNQKLCSIC